MSRAERSTPPWWVIAEWQFTVAQLGSMMVAEMNDQRAGRSSVAPLQPAAASARAAAAAATQASLGGVIGGLCIKVDQAQLRSQKSILWRRRRCWLKCDPPRVPQRPPKQAFRATPQPPHANFRRGDGQRPPV